MFEQITEAGRSVIKVGENVVASNADSLKKELAHIVSAGATQLTIDLAEVSAIDSRGLSVLIAAHNSLQKKGNRLQLVNANADLRKLFQAMRLDQHFEILT